MHSKSRGAGRSRWLSSLLPPHLVRLLETTKLGSRTMVIPLLLSVGASVLEAATLLMLVPTLRGLIDGNFSGVYSRLDIGAAWRDRLSGSYGALVLLVVIYLLATLRSLFVYASNSGTYRRVYLFMHLLRLKLYSAYLNFGKGYLDRVNDSHLQAVLIGHTAAIGRELQAATVCLTSSALVLAYLTLLFYLSWKLSLIVVVGYAIFRFFSSKAKSRIGAMSSQSAAGYSSIGNRTGDVLRCRTLVSLSARDADEAHWLTHQSERVAHLEHANCRRRKGAALLFENVFLAGFLSLLFFVTHAAADGSGSAVGTTLVYFLVLKRLLDNLATLNETSLALYGSAGMAEEVSGLLVPDDKEIVPSGPRRFEGLRTGIEIRSLTHVFPDGRTALRDLTLSIPAGRTTALVGKSGVGKSTLLSLLMRFYDCRPGSIFFDGIDIREFSLESLREKFAWVGQDYPLFGESMRFNLTYGCRHAVDDGMLRDAIRVARLDRLIESLPHGLDSTVGSRGAQISAGERQRVAIARAFLSRPEILLLDEMTASLDGRTEEAIREAFEDVARGKTAIVVTHRLSTVRNAHQILSLDRDDAAA